MTPDIKRPDVERMSSLGLLGVRHPLQFLVPLREVTSLNGKSEPDCCAPGSSEAHRRPFAVADGVVV